MRVQRLQNELFARLMSLNAHDAAVYRLNARLHRPPSSTTDMDVWLEYASLLQRAIGASLRNTVGRRRSIYFLTLEVDGRRRRTCGQH